jgi:hypothetical protein
MLLCFLSIFRNLRVHFSICQSLRLQNGQFGRLNDNFEGSITGFGSYGGYKKGIYDSPRVK